MVNMAGWNQLSVRGTRALKTAACAAIVATMAVRMGPALAEIRTTEKSARAQSGKDVRIGVYINVQPDCTSGPLPTIRLSEPPTNGTVSVRKGKVSATNYKQCLALQVPAFVAIYRSKANFSGTDSLELEVRYPDGKQEIQKFQITVGSSPNAQPI